MRQKIQTTRLALRLCAAVPLCAAAFALRAEVGVVSDPASASLSGAVFVSEIVDGPDITPWVQISSSPTVVALNVQGEANGDGPPALLGNPPGLCIVAWARNSPGGFDIVYSSYADRSWSAPQVLAGTSADELDPYLVQGSDGTVHLFYWEAGTVPRVLHRQAPPDLSSWSAPEQVSQPGIAACRPAAVFHAGILHVAYEVHDYGYGQVPRQVVLARQEQAAFVEEVVAITYNAAPLSPQVHSRGGRLWVDWIDAPGQMAWTQKDVPGGWTPVQMQTFGTILEREFFVRGTIRSLATQ